MPTAWERPAGPPPDPTTDHLLGRAWGAAALGRHLLRDGSPSAAAHRAYRAMLGAAEALVWAAHRRRFRGPAAARAAFWERFARPEAGPVDADLQRWLLDLDADLYRWLLEAYALCGRDGTAPAPRVTREAAAAALAHAEAFLAAAHRHLGLRPRFPPVFPPLAGDPGGA
jgi:hypothetical protein